MAQEKEQDLEPENNPQVRGPLLIIMTLDKSLNPLWTLAFTSVKWV